ncbi:TAXI family TRAP transporter solute-binding subunit [Allosalinactinospora lopnorensis]|uniref:TAXI family TRAP transporter solute-binding subunit n=1 Tax=Allosalinactinospora lopnorensis TaxID=1352348 RepID=UPI000623F0F3|nr:TAXI family TRAP transporter solute-binding subunit [Allosalinactinospora lopnorensis]
MPRIVRGAWAAAAGAVAAAVALAFWAGWGRTAAPLPSLTIATGGPGGVYHVYGASLAESALSRSARAMPTGASVENVRLVAEGEADVGFTLADVAALAVNGQPPFDEPHSVAALARVYDNRTHLIVRDDLPVERADELAGHRVSVGDEGSGTELIADRVLELAGVDPQDDITRRNQSIRESVLAIRAGWLDAVFWSGGLPTEAVTSMAESAPIRLIGLAEYVEPLREEHGDFFTEQSIPAGTYPGVPHVRTIGVPNLLVVSEGMPDEMAEEITRSLFAARDELVEAHPVALHLNPRVAIATLPVPLHPGAAGYYRSQKVAYADV